MGVIEYAEIWIVAGAAGALIDQGGAAPSAPDGAHQVQGLDVNELAAAVEIA